MTDHPRPRDRKPATTQLALQLDGAAPGSQRRVVRSRRAALHHVGRRLLYWSPAAIALLFLLQMAWFGLRQARVESARLDHAEAGVAAREEALVRDHEALVTARRMLADEVYRERVRRSLLAGDRETLSIAGLTPGD